MIHSLLNDTDIPLLQKVAEFGQRRQNVLAGNIANIDTPNYKSRDLPVDEFQSALRTAVQSRHSSPAAVSGSGPLSLDELFPQELFQAATGTARNLTFQDGGNRSIEHEMMEMTKNLMLQNFSIEVMAAQMHMLQMAVDGRL